MANDLAALEAYLGAPNQNEANLPQDEAAVLEQYLGKPPSSPPRQGVVEKLAQSAPVQFTLGLGDHFRDFVANPILGAAGFKNKLPQWGSGTAYNIGGIGGDVLGYGLAGAAIAPELAAARSAPGLVGKAANMISGTAGRDILGRAIGMGGYSALSNPGNRLKSGAKSAALSGALDVGVPAVFNAATRGARMIRPKKTLGWFLNKIGGGRTLSENEESIINDIQKAENARKGEADGLFNIFHNRLRDRPIYHSGITGDSLQDALSGNKKIGAYPNLPKGTHEGFEPTLADLHVSFTEDPSFENARNLHSDLKRILRAFKDKRDAQGPLSSSQNKLWRNYGLAHEAIDADIHNFLVHEDPSGNLLHQFRRAMDNYQENYVPYIEAKNLWKMAQQGERGRPSLATIFKNPDKNLRKILRDLKPETHHKILYSVLGKYTNRQSPEALLRAYDKLDEQGLSHLITPQVHGTMELMRKQLGRRNTAQKLSGGLLGLAGIRTSPLDSELAEAAAAIFGAQATPSVMRALNKALPIEKWSEAIGGAIPKAGKALDPLLRAELLANSPNMWGNQNAN